MLALSTTTDKLSVITAQTCDVDITVDYVDRNQSTFVVGLVDRQLTNITTAGTTDICAAPGATTTRNVKAITVRNASTTVWVDVTIQYNANGTLYEMGKYAMAPSDSLEWGDGTWTYTPATVCVNKSMMVQTVDSVNVNGTGFQDITKLDFDQGITKTYLLIAHLFHVSSATTNGARFGVAPIGASLRHIATIDTVLTSVTASVHSAGSTGAPDTAITAQTTGSTTQCLAIIAGAIIPTIAGRFRLLQAAEVSAAAGNTVKLGSFLEVFEATG